MSQQLHFAGHGFRTELDEPVRPVRYSDADLRKAAQHAAHTAVQAAEQVLLVEAHRPAGREHWARLASGYEQRAQAWLVLAAVLERDPFGHGARAMSLAADGDTARARALRKRLGATG